MRPAEVLMAFDAFLAARGLRFEAVVIGGAALALLGVTDRETRDCDVLDPELPAEIVEAAAAFAKDNPQTVAAGWLNNGPAQLKSVLPKGWEARLVLLRAGEALHLQTLGRSDLLATKLFALCDRETDADDCLRLAPTSVEVEALRPWLRQQDANEAWPAHVDARLDRLLRELGHVRP